MIARVGKLDREPVALLAITFLFPVLLCLVFFPTPAIDLREHINWGLNFPLYTWKHPPLQSWLAGLVALTSVRDAGLYVLVAQILNFVGLFYLVRTAKEFIGEHAAVPIAIAFCGSIYSSVAVVDTALNADQIQMPLWLGLLYHVLRATAHDRWRDWLAGGLFAGLAILAKYFSVVFMLALGLALLVNRSSRIVLRRPGFYLAALVCVLIVAVHLIPLLTHARPELLGYGADSVNFSAPLGRRVNWLATLAGSLVLYGSPLLIALGALALRGGLEWTGRPPTEGARVIVVTTVILFGVILAMVVIGGFRFRTRYGGPLLPIGLLALFCLGGVARDAVQRFARVSLAIWAVIIVGTIGLALAFERVYLRDPAPAAAASMRTEWDRRFSCGPAYVLGHAHSAHAIGLYFGRSVIGLSTGDFAEAPWVDHARLRDLGIVLVGTPQVPPPANLLSISPTPVMTLSRPYRRTWNGAEQVYVYSFVPPQAC